MNQTVIHDDLGKKAEAKIKEWLDRPGDGYCLDRIKDQMTGFYGSKNISDFTLFKDGHFFYIESKATWEDRFPFSMITDYQYDNLLKKSKIDGVFGIIIILFATHQRAFILSINDIDYLQKEMNKHSLNITKIDKWGIPYHEIQTIPSKKVLLDYTGEWDYKEWDFRMIR